LTYKPQLGLLVPVALVAAGRWRVIAAACATATLLIVATSLLFGIAIWPSWVAAIPGFWHQFAVESSEIVHLMPTVFAALLQLGVAPGLAHLAQWMATATAVAIVWVLFRSGPPQLAGAGLLVAALLATPYAFVHDMPPLAAVLIWFVAERQSAGDSFGTGEILVMIFAMISPVMLAAGTSRFPLAALSLVLLLGAIVLRGRRLCATPASSMRLFAAVRRTAHPP
jgi:Glycosyltransferase family 87